MVHQAERRWRVSMLAVMSAVVAAPLREAASSASGRVVVLKVVVRRGMWRERHAVARRWRRLVIGSGALGWLRWLTVVLSLVTVQGITPRADLILEEGAEALSGRSGLIVAWLRGRPADHMRALSRGMFRGPLSRVDVLWGDSYASHKEFGWLPNREAQLRDAPGLLVPWPDVASADLTPLGRRRAGLGLLMNDGSEAWFVINEGWQPVLSALEDLTTAVTQPIALGPSERPAIDPG